MTVRDETTREYTAEYDSARLRDVQKEAYSRAMDDLLARHDAGGELTEIEAETLTKHFWG